MVYFCYTESDALILASLPSSPQVVIFSKTYCPYCAKAKQAIGSLLDLNAVVIIELDKRPDGNAIQDYLLELTGGRSVPRVFIVCIHCVLVCVLCIGLLQHSTTTMTVRNHHPCGRPQQHHTQGGKFIGGGDDTARLAASGELATLLKQAGAL